jgi:nucleoside-diphosphate-sugar epimerase
MILLTGASGFIGKHLLAALIEEYGKENILALTSVPLTHANYLLHNGYHFEPDYFIKSGYGERIEAVIHAGAFTPKSGKQANDVEKCNSNIISANKVLQADLPNLKKIIYLSTLDVYGAADIISESSLTQPASLYGESKLYVEKMVTAWADANDKVHQILRVGHVYGPGEEAYQKIIPVTIKKLLQDQPPQIWGTGNEIRSFIYIKDIVSAILQALKLKGYAGVINLVSSQTITIAALVNKLIALSGKTVSAEILPAVAPGRDFIFDNTKMKQILLAAETTLDTGLAAEWAYFKNLPV